MLNVSEDMWDIWEAGDFSGPNRPVTRADISKLSLYKGSGTGWRSLLFGQGQYWMEIPNIKEVTIDRRLGADAAEMTMTIANTIQVTADVLDENYEGGTGSPTKRELRDLASPGHFTFRRGLAIDTSGVNPWGHDVNQWVDIFIPNRVIRTFQGYGSDGAGIPHQDTNLVQTGTWLIDTVEYKTNGTLTIRCRDLAKLAIEQRLYPPIIPVEHYPFKLCAPHTVTETVNTTTTSERVVTSKVDEISSDLGVHSNGSYKGWDSSVAPYYGYNGSVFGHRASHAFDDDASSYWLSIGNSGPNTLWSYEWIEAKTSGEEINYVQFRPKWGGYVCYIAVKENGVWQGTSTVPYGYWTNPAYPNDSNVRYVSKVTVPRKEEWVGFDLPKTYKADYVRLVFTNLANSGMGDYPYRAAIYDMSVHLKTEKTVTETVVDTVTGTEEVEKPGDSNIRDYVDIVKLFAAFAGWWWPTAPSTDAYLRTWYPETNGRVWGDFFYSGAYPVEPPCIDFSYWDNKSVMDGMNQIKEVLGYILYVDHAGGIIFRPPNIWQTGNYIAGKGYYKASSIRTVDESKVLLDYGVTIDDASLRSDIIVVSADDRTLYGSYQPGYAIGETAPSAVDTSDLALLAGQNRVMLVPNYPFGTADNPKAVAELEKFAFLTSLWIHWSYRKSRFRIPGMPAFMPDDQVRIYERQTSETYIHYIQGYSSTMNLETGQWYMDVDTNWLGNGPDSEWIILSRDMHPALYWWLKENGLIDDDSEPPPDSFVEEIPVTEPYIPRLEDDYGHLFPEPPELVWPDPGYSVEVPDYNPSDDWITEPDVPGGGTSGNQGSSGGSTWYCSNTDKFNYWGPPNQNRVRKQFWTPWRSSYAGLPAYARPWNTHPNQHREGHAEIDSRVWGAMQALIICFCEYEVTIYSESGMVVRANKNDKSSYSNHSWGHAVDFNSAQYPNGTQLNGGGSANDQRFYKAGQAATEYIRAGGPNGPRVFRWGNWYSRTKDAMHFEVCCLPGILNKGVWYKGTKVAGGWA